MKKNIQSWLLSLERTPSLDQRLRLRRERSPTSTLAYKGNTRNPEKVEYFQPPLRFPLSSLREALSPLSIVTSPALVAASLVTSWSPAKAEITGQPLRTKLACEKTGEEMQHDRSSIYIYICFLFFYNSWSSCSFSISMLINNVGTPLWAGIPYLYCLPVVNFDNVKAETVDSFSGGHEDTPRRIKMAANVYEDLRRKKKDSEYLMPRLFFSVQLQVIGRNTAEVRRSLDRPADQHLSGLCSS